MSKFFNKLNTLMCDMEWNVAIRESKSTPIEQLDNRPYHVLKNTWRYWCADPFLFEKDGVTYIFIEVFDRITQKGAIGYRIFANGKCSKIKICLESDYHFSYPYVFEKNGHIYMLPECHESRKLTLYRAICFPDKWEIEEHIMNNKLVCDTNMYETKQGEQVLLTMELDRKKFCYDKLSLYYKSKNGWEASLNNPIVVGADHARNGGALFENGGRLIRPAQNCEKSYGESLKFYHIKKIDKEFYEEELISTFCIRDVCTSKHIKFDGIHTYNRNGKYEVIDLRQEKVFQMARIIYLVRCRVNKIWRKAHGTTD